MTTEDSELLRRSVRDLLHARNPAALPARGLRRRLLTELDFEPALEAVEAACEFWRDQGQLAFDYDEAGGTKWWRITAAGILAVERSGKS